MPDHYLLTEYSSHRSSVLSLLALILSGIKSGKWLSILEVGLDVHWCTLRCRFYNSSCTLNLVEGLADNLHPFS